MARKCALGKNSKRAKGESRKQTVSSRSKTKSTPKKRSSTKKTASNKTSSQRSKKTSKQSLEKINEEILNVSADELSSNSNSSDSSDSSASQSSSYSSDMIEQIMFKLPHVEGPLIGTPKEVQPELDGLAKKIQRRPGSRKSDDMFNKIHLYMHGYLVNVVLKKFPFIKGLQTVDIYQQALIALRFKAIPNFKEDRGMSFLNFSKMCIRRHLITLLNAANGRKKDQAINQAVSLDSSPLSHYGSIGEETATYANIIGDNKDPIDKEFERNEAFEITVNTLMDTLSDLEKTVLTEYLSSSSYLEISENILDQSKNGRKKKNDTKRIDNALLRIRKKAMALKKTSKKESIPLFM